MVSVWDGVRRANARHIYTTRVMIRKYINLWEEEAQQKNISLGLN